MPTVRIDFDTNSLEAVLSSDTVGSHWEAIRLACRDRYEELREVSSTSLRIPWWAFLAAREAIAYHVGAHSVTLDVSAEARAPLDVAIRAQEAAERASEIEPISVQEMHSGLKIGGFERELKPFQDENICRLARLDVGATFSVPGAGKTTEALAFFVLRGQPESRLLVIAPKNAFAAWEEQLAICLPNVDQFVRLGHGRAGVDRTLREEPKLMLITYQLFPNVDDQLTRYLSRHDSFIFLDESHRIKGGLNRVIASAILNIATVPRCRLIMSGTPLPNAVSDLVPQVRFVVPQIPVDEDNVEDVVRPLYVRTTKNRLELPELHRVPRIVPMAPAQQHLYDLMRSEAARQAERLLGSRARNAFRRIGRSAIRLLQFTSNPALLLKKDFEYDRFLGAVLEEGDSPKLTYACTRARKLAREGKKVIIWSSFVENVELIAERLIDLGADFIHGGVEASTDIEANSRENKIKRFHDDKRVFVLVANPAACSEGISLHTVCHHSIYVDRNYNVAQYLQSQDRIHRIGSVHPVIEEILVSPDTIDESVGNRLTQKINAMADVLNDPHLRVDPIDFDLDLADPDDEDVIEILRHFKSGLVSA